MNEIKETLKKLGLTNGEVEVYVALLNLGESTAGAIIKNSKVSSSKVYILLDKLINKGLVTYSIKQKTKHFSVPDPITLTEYVENKEDELSNIKSSLTKICSQIEEIKKTKNLTEDSRIYRGYKGLKTGMFEAIKTIPDNGTYYFFSTGYGEEEFFKNFFHLVVNELKKRKITPKGLAHLSEKKTFEIYYKKLGYKMSYGKLAWPSDITIAGDYLLTLVWDKKEPVLYSVKSSVLVESYLKFFNENWK